MSTVQDFDFSVDVLRALLWQHNKAERLESLLTQKSAWYSENQSDFWANWTRDVFDLRTANAFGCQVWAAILGLKLTIPTSPTNPDAPAFAFGTLRQNFGRGNFGQSGSGSVSLTVEQQRLVLRLRYFQLISRCTVPEINRFMALIFGDLGRVYVQDLNNMEHVVYVFDFTPGSQLTFIFEQYDLLPRPAAVGVSTIVIARPVFGFGALNQNFENGNFAPL